MHLRIASLLLVSYLTATYAVRFGLKLPSCWDGWNYYDGSCYFFATKFSDQSFHSAAQICRIFGAHLVEPNSMDEYSWITGQVANNTWRQGPWLGLMRPHGDHRWILTTQKYVTGDPVFNKKVDNLSMINQASEGAPQCAGTTSAGTKFGFWDCNLPGAPICEIELEDYYKARW